MSFEKPADTPERSAFYKAIEPEGLSALWAVMGNIITPTPKSPCVPHIWRYDSIRARLLEASGLITAKEAERRVLILENPGMRGQSKITTSLYCGVQLVMPGEVAPAHRHSQSALRFVLESSGAQTVVGGERTEMRMGDFIITPHWQWHDHCNDSDQPIFWLDVLDIPIVQFFDASFAEGMGADQQKLLRSEGDSLARYGANMLPLGYEKHTPASPIFNYPYDRSRAALEAMRHQNEWDPCHGLRMRYINPVNGDWAMPSIGTTLQLLPKGFDTQAYRSTDATGFVAVEGRGHSIVAGQRIDWGPRDVFIVPSWHEVTHHPAEDSVLFAFSDRPIQEKLGLHREQRGNH
jgi:gentisate 1,2-dioxygenase